MDDKYVYTTTEDSIRDKTWAAGSSEQIESSEFLIKRDGAAFVGVHERVSYPQSLTKIIDEPIVNALDQMVRCLSGSARVMRLSCDISPDGVVSVYNDGLGVDIEVHPAASRALGREILVPTLVFGVPFQGSNRAPTADSIVGGTNGLGSKLPNCFSTRFTVETTRGSKYFTQTWTDGMKNTTGPTVLTGAAIPRASAHDHTRLTFRPDYVNIYKYRAYTPELHDTLCALIRTRMWFAAAYASATQPGSRVTFNGEIIPVKCIADIARVLFPHSKIVSATIAPKALGGVATHMTYPWEVVAVIKDWNSEPKHLSNVNGVVVHAGKHFQNIHGKIAEGVRLGVAKRLKDKNIKWTPAFIASNISSNIFLMINSKVPGAQWTGQRKDVLEISPARLAGYELPPAFVAPLTAALSDSIVDSMEGREPRKAPVAHYEHYRKADWAGGRRSLEAALIATEGNSAMNQVIVGGANKLNWHKYGVISLGGVIINTRKESTRVETATGSVIKRSSKLINNVFMNVLISVTGLNPRHKYDPASTTYKREMNELNYGAVIAFVDQDHDGKGNILGLLLNVFEQYWPNLLRDGYVKWAISPIVRAYPKAGGKVKEFYSVYEFEQWEATADSRRYDARYFKGLGTHSREENMQIFKQFEAHIRTFTTDSRTTEMFEIYYGRDPSKRKTELSKPSLRAPIEYSVSSVISATDQLLYEANPYQKDNLDRKLDNCLDGQNQAGRKVLNGVLAMRDDKPINVNALSGIISSKQHYDHGQASLADSITRKAFVAVGGKQLPLIVPLSNFGTRLEGGNDAAAPRYIFTQLNRPVTDLLFNKDDYWLLSFNMDDGKPTEPKYFLPIIPLAVIESVEIPSHGWKLKTWARDVYRVIDNVQRLIRVADDAPVIHLPAATYARSAYPWRGEIRSVRGQPHSFGRYHIDGNLLTITELPLRRWNLPYMTKMRKKASLDKSVIAEIKPDMSTDLTICIIFVLQPGAIERLENYADSVWADGIEEYFELHMAMDSCLNMMGANMEVLTFESYDQIVYHWFPYRKAHYIARVARQTALFELRIELLTQLVRYISNNAEYRMANRRKADMIALLVEHGYPRFDTATLSAPKYTPTADLRTAVTDGPSATYDYLLGLTELDKSAEGLERAAEKLAKCQGKFDEHVKLSTAGRFPGAVVWSNELEALRAVIAEGEKTRWLYGNASKFVYE